MAIEQLNIEIIDTYTNTMVLIDEKTEINSPRLIYNGQDDKFQSIMASELQFNILVTDASDAKFSHLYTNQEDRYLVKVNDITDSQNIVTLWSGHLLPEQFNEPYRSGVYFVGFIATDGIGRLKGKYLSDDSYTSIKSATAIIAECLKLTNNNFPIYIAPAVFSAEFALTYDKMEFNTTAYLDGESKLSAYTILENILSSLGLKLFQEKEKWYLIGINRFDITTIDAQLFDVDGVYLSNGNILRNSLPAYFENSSLITMYTSFKTVVTKWKNEYNKSFLPEDIIYQPSITPVDFDLPVPVKHWQAVGNTNVTLHTVNYTSKSYKNAGKVYYKNEVTPVIADDPWFVAITQPDNDFTTTYIEFTDPYYLDLELNNIAKLNVSIELHTLTDTDLKVHWVSSPDGADTEPFSTFKDAFKYDILFNGVVLVSNKTPFPNAADYNFKVTHFDDTKIKAVLKLDKIPIVENGYLQFRLSVRTTTAPAIILKTVFQKMDFEYETEQNEIINKTRTTNNTTIKEVTLFHSDDDKDFTAKQILFSNTIPWSGKIINIPEAYPQMAISNYVTDFYEDYTGTLWEYREVNLDYDSYLLITQYPDDVFIKRNDALPYEAITQADYETYFIDGIYTFRMGNALNWIEAVDTLFIHTIAKQIVINDKRYVRERFKRFGKTEDVRHLEAMALIYHDAAKDPLFMVNGKMFGYVNPLDIITFNFNSQKNFIPIAINIDLADGSSEVQLIDQTISEVIDYE